jgi:hypothetical protein
MKKEGSDSLQEQQSKIPADANRVNQSHSSTSDARPAKNT